MHDSPVSLDAVAAQDNDLGPAGAEALRPTLEKLPNIKRLFLSSTCGDVQRRSAQCARVGGGARAGQAVVIGCDGLFACEV